MAHVEHRPWGHQGRISGLDPVAETGAGGLGSGGGLWLSRGLRRGLRRFLDSAWLARLARSGLSCALGLFGIGRAGTETARLLGLRLGLFLTGTGLALRTLFTLFTLFTRCALDARCPLFTGCALDARCPLFTGRALDARCPLFTGRALYARCALFTG
ncbi:MAG: hypothetical protein ACI9D0_001964, partial [Bacteroidia bacterium]